MCVCVCVCVCVRFVFVLFSFVLRKKERKEEGKKVRKEESKYIWGLVSSSLSKMDRMAFVDKGCSLVYMFFI